MKLRLPNKLVAAIMAAASPVMFQTLSTATVGAAAVAAVSSASATTYESGTVSVSDLQSGDVLAGTVTLDLGTTVPRIPSGVTFADGWHGVVDADSINVGDSNGNHAWADATTPYFRDLLTSTAFSGGTLQLKTVTGATSAEGSFLSLQLGGSSEAATTYTFTKNTITTGTGGNLRISDYSHDNVWQVANGTTLDVGGMLWIDHRQKLSIEGGSVVATGGLKLGYGANNLSKGLTMSGADSSLKTASILMYGNAGSPISLTGGTLEFTGIKADGSALDNVLDLKNDAILVTLGGSGENTLHLKAGSTAWKLSAANDKLTLGNVTVDAAEGGTQSNMITLGAAGITTKLTGTITNKGALTLAGTMLVANGQSATIAGTQETVIDGCLAVNGTLALGADSQNATVTANRILLSAVAASNATLTINADTKLQITGTTQSVVGNEGSMMLSNWSATNTVNVYGTLESAAAISARDGRFALNVKNGGELVMKAGISAVGQNGAGGSTLTVESGGVLKSATTVLPTSNRLNYTLTLNDGATFEGYYGEDVGAVSIAKDMTLGEKGESGTGVNFNVADDKTFTLTGTVSGDAAQLNKVGSGILQLNGTTTVGNLNVTAGSVQVVGSSAALTVNDAYTVGNGTTVTVDAGTLILGKTTTGTTAADWRGVYNSYKEALEGRTSFTNEAVLDLTALNANKAFGNDDKDSAKLFWSLNDSLEGDSVTVKLKSTEGYANPGVGILTQFGDSNYTGSYNLNASYDINGGIAFTNYSIGSGNYQRWTLGTGKTLTTYSNANNNGKLALLSRTELYVDGGKVDARAGIAIGHQDTAEYASKLTLHNGEVKTTNVLFRTESNGKFVMDGGTLEFTQNTGSAFTVSGDITPSVSLGGGTLKAATSSWNVDWAADNKNNFTVGNVAFDIADGKTITLNNVTVNGNLSAAATNAGTLVLKNTTVNTGQNAITAGVTMELLSALRLSGANNLALSGNLIVSADTLARLENRGSYVDAQGEDAENGFLTGGKVIVNAAEVAGSVILADGFTFNSVSPTDVVSVATDGSLLYTADNGNEWYLNVSDSYTGAESVGNAETVVFQGENVTLTASADITQVLVLKQNAVLANAQETPRSFSGALSVEADSARTLTFTGAWKSGDNLNSDAAIAVGTADAAGNLTVTLDSESASTGGAVSIANGSELSLAKGEGNTNDTLVLSRAVSGSGALVFESGNWKVAGSANNNSYLDGYAGNITIAQGAKLTLQNKNDSLGVSYSPDSSRELIIGGELDLNGKEAYYAVCLQDGAVISNSGSAVGVTSRNLPKVEIEGENATVKFNTVSNISVLGSAYAQSAVNLGVGKNNTLVKTGNNSLFLVNTKVTGDGSLEVQKGTLEFRHDNHAVASVGTDADTTIKLNGETETAAAKLKITANNNADTTNISVGKVTVDNGKYAELLRDNNQNVTLKTTAVEATGQLKANVGFAVGDNLNVAKKGSSNIILNGVGISDSGITKTKGASAATISHADITVGDTSGAETLLALADAVSYNISDVALVDTNITSQEQLTVSHVSLDAASSISAAAGSTLSGANHLTLSGTENVERDGTVITSVQMSGLTLQTGSSLTLGMGNHEYAEGVKIGDTFSIKLSDFSWQDLVDASVESYTAESYADAHGGASLDDVFKVLAIGSSDTHQSYYSVLNVAKYETGIVIEVQVPEPTTATLSLLALAGLAARRRRK